MEWELSLVELCDLRNDALDQAEFRTVVIYGNDDYKEDVSSLYAFCQDEYLRRTGQYRTGALPPKPPK